jgi:hypothetical protein
VHPNNEEEITMTEITEPPRETVKRGLSAWDDLGRRAEDAETRAANLEQQVALLLADNARMTKELRQVGRQCDQLLRAYSTLRGTLDAFIEFQKSGAGMLATAIDKVALQMQQSANSDESAPRPQPPYPAGLNPRPPIPRALQQSMKPCLATDAG